MFYHKKNTILFYYMTKFGFRRRKFKKTIQR